MARRPSPSVVALAGPNGSGKSPAGPALLKETLGISEFVNADVIARGLSAFAPEKAAFSAGRLMLVRMRQLAARKMTFAFETTLTGRSHAVWIRRLLEHGYQFQLILIWLPSADFAVRRVRDRVRLGGHGISEVTIRRRYRAGLRNFFRIYRPLAAGWRVYDNSAGPAPRLVAEGIRASVTTVEEPGVWSRIELAGRL